MFLNSLLFAIGLSVDLFGVGIAYGVRNIKIAVKSRMVLFSVSFVIVLLSIILGKFFLSFFPSWISPIVSSCFLAIMGCFIIIQSIKKKTGISKILADPSVSDFDRSSSIDLKEALFLGLSISADSASAGMCYGSLYNSLLGVAILISVFHLLFLSLGIILGKKIKSISSLTPTIWSILSGTILILLSIINIVID